MNTIRTPESEKELLKHYCDIARVYYPHISLKDIRRNIVTNYQSLGFSSIIEYHEYRKQQNNNIPTQSEPETKKGL